MFWGSDYSVSLIRFFRYAQDRTKDFGYEYKVRTGLVILSFDIHESNLDSHPSGCYGVADAH